MKKEFKNLQPNSNSYYEPSYRTKAMFISCWHQINEVVKTRPNKFLEIGLGNGDVSSYLKNRKINVKTFDIDKGLNPNVVGNVLQLNKYFSENSFDTILCAEVLEHLPFSSFEKSLEEISKVSKTNVIISLPHHALHGFFAFQIPKIKELILTIKIPFPLLYKRKREGTHYWEIGWKHYPLNKIKKIISKYFEIRKTYVVPENPYHRFFILKVKNNIPTGEK